MLHVRDELFEAPMSFSGPFGLLRDLSAGPGSIGVLTRGKC
jgi:hypothetical protein